MATYDLPAWFGAAALEWGLERCVTSFDNPVTGASAGVDLLGNFWIVSVTLPPRRIAAAGEVEAWFAGMVGGIDRVRLHHMARPVPKGTMRGEPVLAAPLVQFANVLQIQTTAGATVSAGDMLGVGGQLMQARFNATADDEGLLLVPTSNRSRKAVAVDAAVSWNRPTAEFIITTNRSRASFMPGRLDGPAYEFKEYFQ